MANDCIGRFKLENNKWINKDENCKECCVDCSACCGESCPIDIGETIDIGESNCERCEFKNGFKKPYW